MLLLLVKKKMGKLLALFSKPLLIKKNILCWSTTSIGASSFTGLFFVKVNLNLKSLKIKSNFFFVRLPRLLLSFNFVLFSTCPFPVPFSAPFQTDPLARSRLLQPRAEPQQRPKGLAQAAQAQRALFAKGEALNPYAKKLPRIWVMSEKRYKLI